MSDLDNLIDETIEAIKDGTIKPRKKCCGKCAFRKNSPERSDGYGWVAKVERWVGDIGGKKHPFLCHEGVPGHSQQVEGRDLEVCGGWNAMQNASPDKWYGLAGGDFYE